MITAASAKTARTGLRVAIDSRRVLAASGFVMVAYLVVHSAGNLLAFAGSGTFDAYARSLRQLGSPLFGEGVLLMAARAVLATALVAHLAAHAVTLIRPAPARRACPSRIASPGYVANAFPIPHVTGAAILLFLSLHLAHLTFGATLPSFDPASPYHNLVTGLASWPVTLGYITAAAAVAGHLVPGVWSGMSHLGLIGPRTHRLAAILSPAIAVATALGIASVPVAVLTGVLR